MKYVPLSAVMAVTVAGHAHMHCYILREKDKKIKKIKKNTRTNPFKLQRM